MARTSGKMGVPQGTFELLILKALSLEPMHGLGISRRLEQLTRGALQVNPGSFFPVLHRMEDDGWVRGEWGKSENNRRAKYYRLTSVGRKKFQQEEKHWRHVASTIFAVLETN